jgi:hypothetical protein
MKTDDFMGRETTRAQKQCVIIQALKRYHQGCGNFEKLDGWCV